MKPFNTLSGVVVPMIEDDINTDQMAPLQLMRGLEPDYGAFLFMRRRLAPDGSVDPDHVLNKPQYATASILLSGHNFGCGSSREAAVWCLTGRGIRCVIARSIADIFKDNCLKNGVLAIELDGPAMDSLQAAVLRLDGSSPFVVDLEAQTISEAGAAAWSFDIAPADKQRLMEGLDEIGLTLKSTAAIEAWERATAASDPWLQFIKVPD